MPDFNMQQNFPIASVIDAAVRNKALNQQAQQQNQENMIQGINAIGAVGQSLYQRKLQMAQALSGAKMYAASPEGQQMLAPTPTGLPPTVTQNQTAAYDPSSGSVTPNMSMPTTSSIAPSSQVTSLPTSRPSPISMGDLQTAFMGEKPADLMSQLFNRQKERQEFGLKSQNQIFEQQFKPKQLQSQENVAKTLAGIKSTEVTNTNAANLRSSIATLKAHQDTLVKQFPDLAGSIASGILPSGLNQQETAAVNAYKDDQAQIDGYNLQLQRATEGGGSLSPKHMSTAELLAKYKAATGQP